LTKPFAGKAAVVTGGSRGIGLAIARQLAIDGCHVTIAGRDPQALKRAVAQFQSEGLEIESQSCDVASEKDVENIFSKVQQRFGKLDYLVNNAGTAHPLTNVERLSLNEFRRVLDVNLTGTFLCARAAIPLMSAGAVIVNNLSVAATQVFAGMAAYCAAKAGALAFTNTLREELRERGIRVLALIPGAVNTDIWNQFWPEAPREKMISAEDVARAVVLALSMPQSTAVDEIRIGPALGKL
jgi:NAD(P)-dependent dehydrogenase (short-subunit alcohol dehydrogenase family)